MDYQNYTTEMDLYTDSDWANDVKTRKSTSGGVVMLGGHVLLSWSRVQSTIALSSGEAELNSSVKGISEIIGIINLSAELGFTWNVRHRVDATACKGIMIRTGAGKVKHLSTRQLWIQEAIRKYGIQIIKIPRDDNVADLLARKCNSRDLAEHLQKLNTGGPR